MLIQFFRFFFFFAFLFYGICARTGTIDSLFSPALPDSGENGGTFSQRHAPSAYFCHAHRNAHQFSSGHTAGYCVRGSFVGLSQTVCRTGTVSCGFKQSAEIRFDSASHCGWLATMKTIILAGISVAVFGAIMNLYTGFCETDPDKLKHKNAGRQKDALLKVILPGSVPLILSVMKVNIGLSLIEMSLREMIGSKSGLGCLIIYSSQVFQLTTMLYVHCNFMYHCHFFAYGMISFLKNAI